MKSAAIAGVFWTSAIVLSPGLRLWMDEKLRHVWLEEAYVGRMLWRFQIAEAFLQDPRHWRGLAVSRIERLRKRYELGDVSLREVQPAAPRAAEFWASSRLYAGDSSATTSSYYVDTLRADVANDPKTMPSVASFSANALDFSEPTPRLGHAAILAGPHGRQLRRGGDAAERHFEGGAPRRLRVSPRDRQERQ